MREHGLKAPYNSLQIGTWILLPTIMIQYILFVTPVLSSAASAILTILILVCVGSSAYFGLMTSITNPIDARLYMQLKQKQEKQQLNGETPTIESNKTFIIREQRATCIPCVTPPSPLDRLPPNYSAAQDEQDNENTKFCWVCQARVEVKSMHCKFCDKCVSTFDHHCQWLNTCVGEANYHFFLKTVMSICCLSIIHVISSCISLGLYFTKKSTIQKWFFYQNQNDAVWIAFVVIFLAINAGVTILISQLLYFHYTLHLKRITTYEYIIQDNAKRREKEKEDILLRQRREAELKRVANFNGYTLYKWRLSLGAFKFCKVIDPLRNGKELPDIEQASDTDENGPPPLVSSAATNGNHLKKKQYQPFVEESKSQDIENISVPQTSIMNGRRNSEKEFKNQIESLDITFGPFPSNSQSPAPSIASATKI